MHNYIALWKHDNGAVGSPFCLIVAQWQAIGCVQRKICIIPHQLQTVCLFSFVKLIVAKQRYYRFFHWLRVNSKLPPMLRASRICCMSVHRQYIYAPALPQSQRWPLANYQFVLLPKLWANFLQVHPTWKGNLLKIMTLPKLALWVCSGQISKICWKERRIERIRTIGRRTQVKRTN